MAPAVSSPPLNQSENWSEAALGLVENAAHLRYVNLAEQGFVILDVMRDRVRAEYIYTDSAKVRSRNSRCGAAFEARSGSNHVERVDQDACKA